MKKMWLIFGMIAAACAMNPAFAFEQCNVKKIRVNQLVFPGDYVERLETKLLASGYTLDETRSGLTVSYFLTASHRGSPSHHGFKTTLSIWNESGEKEWSTYTRTGNRQSLIDAIPLCTQSNL